MTEKIKHGNVFIRIEQDEDPCNPRDDENMGQMICWHSRYRLGDANPECDPWMFWLVQMRLMHPDVPDDISPENVRKWRDKHYCWLPLYLYDHGGITMSTSSFSDRWDSGQIGWIYISLKKAAKGFSVPADWSSRVPWAEGVTYSLHEVCQKVMESEVKTYDMYLTNQVYEYVIEDEDGIEFESCSGFYGEEHCLAEAKSAADYINKKLNESSFSI